MKTAVKDTSAAAWRSMACDKLKTQNDRVQAIVEASDGDMSLGEIKVIYRQLFQRDVPEDRRIEANTISRIVNDLVSTKRLDRLETARKCKFTGIEIHPVRIPVRQNNLFDLVVE